MTTDFMDLAEQYHEAIHLRQKINARIEELLRMMEPLAPLSVGDVVTKIDGTGSSKHSMKSLVIGVKATTITPKNEVRFEYWGQGYKKDGTLGNRKGRLYGGTWQTDKGEKNEYIVSISGE